jgi:hypothetical protein
MSSNNIKCNTTLNAKNSVVERGRPQCSFSIHHVPSAVTESPSWPSSTILTIGAFVASTLYCDYSELLLEYASAAGVPGSLLGVSAGAIALSKLLGCALCQLVEVGSHCCVSLWVDRCICRCHR